MKLPPELWEREVKVALAALTRYPVVAPEERRLAGAVSGVLYGLGGATLTLLGVLPGVSGAHRTTVLAIAAIALLWSLCATSLIDWRTAPGWLIHAGHSAALALIAVAVASSGGATSPASIYLLLPVVFAAYFYRPELAIAYIAACVVVQLLPLAYDHRAIDGTFLAQVAVAAPAYIVLGGAIIRSRAVTSLLRSQTEQLAAEQSALRRVATAVVDGEQPEIIYELAAREMALLLRAGAAGILRFDGRDAATVMGAWAGRGYLAGSAFRIGPGSDIAVARERGIPVTFDSRSNESSIDLFGYRTGIVAPMQVGGRPWGVLVVAGPEPRFTPRDEDRLLAFGDLLATAITSLEDRAKLASQASTDPLTGLLNHRMLQARLAAEVARAVRHDVPLSVAVIDVDHFKQINDTGGHDAGDEVLVGVAQCLRELARIEDTLGRVGGDEFAWILPETNQEQALVAVERARNVISAFIAESFQVTLSAGICDTRVTGDPAELIRFADGALYWSKAHGRNQCWIYDPKVVNELSAQERAERLERSQALLGLRALARAIDAKDPATRSHSERVSELAAKLAKAAGWSPDKAGLLSEAALVHDVGKIGIPDAVLRKVEPLTTEEWMQIAEHSELSARITADVLTSDQVEWIRTHHERPDGNGYPDGLMAEEIPEGGALLALADAWDVMTVSRPYGVPKGVEEALAECLELVGQQFTEVAVAALVQLYDVGVVGVSPDAVPAATGASGGVH